MEQRRDTRSIILYALPVFFLAVMIGPAGSIVQGIYTREFGLPLSSIAGLIVACRILDAFTDPTVGILSDKTRNWRGGRKVWVALGSIIILGAVYFLFNPTPGKVTPEYFFLAYLFTFVGWTVAEVSHLSWGAELARSYDDRSRIFAYRMGFLFAGTLLFLALPIGIGAWHNWNAAQPLSLLSETYNGETLRIAFWFILAFFPLAVGLSIWFCPTGSNDQQGQPFSVRKAFDSLRWNRPMGIFALVLFLFFLGNGMQVAMAYLHLASYLQLGKQAPLIYVLCFPLNVLTIPLWLRLTNRIGKNKALALGVAVSSLLFIALGMVKPGEHAFMSYLLIFAGLQCAQAAWQALPPAILGDIADYGNLKVGSDQTATYYSLFAFLQKAVSGFGAAIGFSVAGWFGFDPALDTHDGSSAMGIRIVMAFIPAALGLLAAWVILKQPIDRRRHDIIRKALARRGRSQ